MMSLRENITAVIETCFSETKEEIQDTAINRILELIRADRKTENSSEIPNNSTISKMEQVDEPMKTTDYCDICKRDMCEICVADATNPYCVPSHYEINYEPKDEPQTERSE